MGRQEVGVGEVGGVESGDLLEGAEIGSLGDDRVDGRGAAILAAAGEVRKGGSHERDEARKKRGGGSILRRIRG